MAFIPNTFTAALLACAFVPAGVPNIAAGRFQPFTGDAQIAPGIEAHAAPGHTAGHRAPCTLP